MEFDFKSRELCTYSSEFLERCLEDARRIVGEADEELTALATERSRILLLNDDEKLAAVETKLSWLQRERDRAVANVARIEGYVAAYPDKHARAIENYERVQAMVDSANEWLVNEYPVLAQQLADGLKNVVCAQAEAGPLNTYRLPHGRSPLSIDTVHMNRVTKEAKLPELLNRY